MKKTDLIVSKKLDLLKYILSINLLILIVLFSGGRLVYAQSQDELMKGANKFYQEGNYHLALESYKRIIGQGYESGALFYNLGNAYFKTGQLGHAIYSYEKGLKLEPNDEDLAYNLKIANARTVDKITELPKLFIVSWWEGLVTSLNVTGWSLTVVIVFWILLLSIAVYFLSRRNNLQKFAFMSASIFLALFIFTAVLLFARVNREAVTNYGVLLAPTYTVKLSPDIKSNDAFVIHEGIKFAVEDYVNEWAKIRLIDGKVGWAQKNVFGQI
ncbi:MAG: hypothetical protein CVV24_07290 [Ignavibacteriae bacterium HGW-Ignavibacteriae-3]|nr:MAG: hypothetical protein CVV24_07290 [Ignavibacteriae bacterium HGW-Ignavibacteriae-3]